MQKITPFLWFNGQAEEAMQFYTSIFPRTRVGDVMRYGDAGPGPKGSVMSCTFELEGQEFIALNGGPMFQFSPAISFFVKCATQAEVDTLWEKLGDGGRVQQCGWLQDRFGVSWQIVPTVMLKMMSDPDRVKAKRASDAMMKMVKLDIAKLTTAYEGKS